MECHVFFSNFDTDSGIVSICVCLSTFLSCLVLCVSLSVYVPLSVLYCMFERWSYDIKARTDDGLDTGMESVVGLDRTRLECSM